MVTITGASAISLGEVRTALAEVQPTLAIVGQSWPLKIEGQFTVQSPEGPVDNFDIRIELFQQFPSVEPKVFEIGNRIPKTSQRHINPGGDCCVTVWESWLVTAKDHSFKAFLQRPLQEYFLNQCFFEKNGNWRLGERPHGLAGAIEAYADALGIERDGVVLKRYLVSIAGKPKGHLTCPCGSGKILRYCHKEKLHKLYADFPPGLAQRMLQRLVSQGLT